MSERIIRARIERLQKAFTQRYENTKILYASKAFLTRAMARIVADTDIGIDVVSGGELHMAVKGGVDPATVYFHGNNKSFQEIEEAIEMGVGYVVVDNTYELMRLETLLEEKELDQDILLRLSPGLTEIDTHEYIITGQRDTKFGFQIDDRLIDEVIPSILSSKRIHLKGFHYHIGSQLFDNPSYLKAFSIIYKLMAAAYERFGFETQILNIGGGFGISYSKDQDELDIEHLLEEIMMTINQAYDEGKMKRPEIVIEPGRWLVGPAGITLYTVGAIKEIPHVRTYAAIDGGMTDNIRPALYKASYDFDIANKISEEKTQYYAIAGKACESGDLLTKEVLLPELASGDILVTYATGAYGYAMASNYNKHLTPAVVMTEDGTHRLIVRRQTYEDLLSREME
jgi:diaminopimelate decarboxylase